MTNNRLYVLRAMVASNPNDSFARYGLAMECVKGGNLQDAVGDEFHKLLEANPKGTMAAYFHGGQALEKLERSTRRGRCMSGVSKRQARWAILTHAANYKRLLISCSRPDIV